MRLFRFILALIILLFGILTSPHIKTSGYVLDVMHWTCFTLPFICQFFPYTSVKVYGLWFGVFMVLQGSITPLISKNFKTLEPNYVNTIDVQQGMPGIYGIQRITTDHKGFRVTKAINYQQKPENVFRIFAIGASTTEQIFLDDKQTWTHLLQEHLDRESTRNVEIINTGVSGLRAEHHLATLQGIADYQPDMVIFMMGLNDWNYHIHHRFGGGKKRLWYKRLREKLLFEKSTLAKFILQILPPAGLAEAELPTETVNGIYDSLRNSLARPIKKKFREIAVLSSYLQTLKDIKMECLQQHIQCVFLSQPHGYDPNARPDYIEGLWMTPPRAPYTLDLESMEHLASVYNQTLIDLATQDHFLTCDVAIQIPADYTYMYDDCHFNTNGAIAVAKVVSQCIRENRKNKPPFSTERNVPGV